MKVARVGEMGAFLDAQTGNTSDDILLHKLQQTSPVKPGDKVSVFLYKDPHGRLTASMRTPRMREGQIARLKVINTSRDGAFLDVGAERGIFMPYAGMRGKLQVGEVVWAKLYTDKSGRLAMTMKVEDEIRRRRVREVTFSDLALYEERQLYTVDKYFQDEEAEPSYQMAGKEITPKLLLEAIRALPEERRKIILLYYFEGLTDIEIGKQLNISRSTVQYRRTSSFEQLKKYLEENADEWIEW